MNKLFVAQLNKGLPSYQPLPPGTYVIAARNRHTAEYYLFGINTPKSGFKLCEIPKDYLKTNQVNSLDSLLNKLK